MPNPYPLNSAPGWWSAQGGKHLASKLLQLFGDPGLSAIRREDQLVRSRRHIVATQFQPAPGVRHQRHRRRNRTRAARRTKAPHVPADGIGFGEPEHQSTPVAGGDLDWTLPLAADPEGQSITLQRFRVYADIRNRVKATGIVKRLTAAGEPQHFARFLHPLG